MENNILIIKELERIAKALEQLNEKIDKKDKGLPVWE